MTALLHLVTPVAEEHLAAGRTSAALQAILDAYPTLPVGTATQAMKQWQKKQGRKR